MQLTQLSLQSQLKDQVINLFFIFIDIFTVYTSKIKKTKW